MNNVPNIVEQYVKLIIKGVKSINDVPDELRQDVNELLNKLTK